MSKKLIIPLFMLALCGCRSQYVMKLTNGTVISTPSKPRLKGSTYYYKDAQGHDNLISQSRVLEIEPASMAAEEKRFEPQKPYKKPWWKFW